MMAKALTVNDAELRIKGIKVLDRDLGPVPYPSSAQPWRQWNSR